MATQPALAAAMIPSVYSDAVVDEGDGSAFACAASDVSAVAQVSLSSAPHLLPALVGVLRFTNHSSQACMLVGTPAVQVVDANGGTLPVIEDSAASGDTLTVLVPPGGQALAEVNWRNFCAQPPPPTPYEVRITLPGGGGTSAPFDTAAPFAPLGTPPPCLDRAAPSIIAVGAFALAPPVIPHDARYFPQTGYRIDNDAIWDYFNRRGGVTTFGYPTSRTFLFQGFIVQFFQRRVVQLDQQGHPRLLNLLGPGLLPYTRVNGSTFPAADAALAAAAPAPTDQPAVLAWVRQHAPDSFDGAPVDFYSTFANTVSARVAFPGGGDLSLLPGFDLEMWGVPTSEPTVDPNNHHFIYLRWQRGIMQHDAACGCTRGVLLGDALKAVVTGLYLPRDLAQEARGSPLLHQYDTFAPNWVHNPALLPDTDLIHAFDQE